MADLIAALATAAGAGPTAEIDPNFNQTVLLLHGDGTDGAQNNTFLDSSTNNFTITRNGNTTQGSFSPFSLPNGEWSNYFDGNSDWLSVSASAMAFSTGDFTIQALVYLTGYPTSTYSYIYDARSANTASDHFLRVEATGILSYRMGFGTLGSTTATVPLNAWTLVSVTRASGTVKIYIDAVEANSHSGSTANLSIGSAVGIGCNKFDGTQGIKGYISNFRVNIGTAETITIPTTPLTAISGTSLLTCQSNRFVDNSTNAFAITVNGNTSVQPFSPFAPSAAYSTSVNGGSGYFDGNGDRLTVPNGSDFTFSGAFSVEGWIYPTNLATGCTFLETRTGLTTTNYAFYCNTTTSQPRVITSGGVILSSSVNPIANQWNHIAWSSDGSTLRVYVNGVSGGTVAQGSLTTGAATTVGFGGTPLSATSYALTGFLSGLRVVNGTDTYPSAFTPPTAPLTAVTNTKLLCNFTNAGIFDNTGKNNLETVGNAQIDITTKKFGGSMEFDGTGDRLSSVPSQNSVFGTGDFTIECWVYVSSFPASATPIVSNWAGANPAWILRFSSGSGNVGLTDNSSSFLSSSSAISLSTWTHIAVARSGTSLKMFFDGVEVASTTNSTSLGNASTGIHVGAYYNTTYPLAGFVDDLRITKGVARYTTTFTPPTKAFPDL